MTQQPTPRRRRPRVVRLPGFVSEEDIGAGELVTRITRRVGIKPCGGCARRAAAMDSRLVLRGSRRS